MDKVDLNNAFRILDPKPMAVGREPTSAPQKAFGLALLRSINDVNQRHQEAEQAVEALSTGQNRDLHQTMIALEKADVSFRLLMQVRNKIISAYQEIMRMQI